MKIQVSSSLIIEVRYLWKKDNSFYYKRKLPGSKSYKYVHLRTSDPLIAAQLLQIEAAKDDTQWSGTPNIPSDVNNSSMRASIDPTKGQVNPLTGNGVCDLYLRMRKGDANFEKMTKLAFKLFIDYCGDKPVAEYRRREINAFVSSLQTIGKNTATIRRRVKSLSAGFGLGIREEELGINNPFERIMVPGEHEDTVHRLPFTESELQTLKTACVKQSDDLRWILLILAYTGARLAEIVGLAVEDVVLSDPVPYIHIRSHKWRRLKTKSSDRKVPLVGDALWAATYAVEAATSTLLFARYTELESCNTNGASQTLNKWIRNIGIDKTCHSLRHTMRDRLRAIECPSELMNMIGGWTTGDVGSRYGKGYPLKVKQDWLDRAMESFSPQPTNGISTTKKASRPPEHGCSEL